jgi:hypothetical protein
MRKLAFGFVVLAASAAVIVAVPRRRRLTSGSRRPAGRRPTLQLLDGGATHVRVRRTRPRHGAGRTFVR